MFLYPILWIPLFMPVILPQNDFSATRGDILWGYPRPKVDVIYCALPSRLHSYIYWYTLGNQWLVWWCHQWTFILMLPWLQCPLPYCPLLSMVLNLEGITPVGASACVVIWSLWHPMRFSVGLLPQFYFQFTHFFKYSISDIVLIGICNQIIDIFSTTTMQVYSICECTCTRRYSTSKSFFLSECVLWYVEASWMLSYGVILVLIIRRSTGGVYISYFYRSRIFLMVLGRNIHGPWYFLYRYPFSFIYIFSSTPRESMTEYFLWVQFIMRGISTHVWFPFTVSVYTAESLVVYFGVLWFPHRSIASKSDFLVASSIWVR